MSHSTTPLKVAIVRCPPPNWPLPLANRCWDGITINIDQCVSAAIEHINQAKANGAELVTFPELWFPGFPKWREQNNWKETHLAQYIDNSMVVGGEQWNRLIDAIKTVGVWTSLGFSERAGDHIYMSQALISNVGEIVIHRHKLRPSGSERDMFSDGTIDQFYCVNSAIGRVSMMECGEHFYPSMTFPMAAQRPKLHIGAFPYVTDYKDTAESFWFNAELTSNLAASFAFLSGAHVIMPAIGYAFIFDPMTRKVAEIKDEVPYSEQPILYHTLNIDMSSNVPTHDPDCQVSYGTLRQINESFPAYIPKNEGSLTTHRKVSCDLLKKGNWEWCETGPGTPAK